MRIKLLTLIIFCWCFVSCASTMGYRAEIKGYHKATTGNYLLHKASPEAVRNIWDARTDYDGLPVESFADWGKQEIWYTTPESLEHEKEVVSSYKALREEAERDAWNYSEMKLMKIWDWGDETRLK